MFSRIQLITPALAALLVSQLASAQPTERLEEIEIPCSSAPAAAKTQLPSRLAEWAALSCTRFGHVVRAAPGWVWHTPRTKDYVRLWAQPHGPNLDATGHSDHFTRLDFKQLSPQEANEANEALAAELGAKPQPVSDAFVLLMQDARGQTHAIHFVRTEANVRVGNLWGWACTHPCTKPQVFMAFKP